MEGFPFLPTIGIRLEGCSRHRNQPVQILRGETEMGVFKKLQVSVMSDGNQEQGGGNHPEMA